jgi:hypothetical protein
VSLLQADEPTRLEGVSAPDTAPGYAGTVRSVGRVSERPLRLFACACCRRIWGRLAPACRRAVEAAERFADGRAGPEELADAWRACRRLEKLRRPVPTEESEEEFLAGRATALRYYQITEEVHRVADPTFTLADAAAVTDDLRPWRGESLDHDEADAARDRLLADVLGPVPAVVFDAAWRTPAVLALARSAYDDGDFGRLPALADALAAAGCKEAALLGHCRRGEHARGCWAVDLILGRE